MYQQGAPEDDIRERVEEMERMRESVFKEMDTNKDGFIDFEEFLKQTKRPDFEQDNGWQGIDEQHQYTDEELDEYIRQHQVCYILHFIFNIHCSTLITLVMDTNVKLFHYKTILIHIRH